MRRLPPLNAIRVFESAARNESFVLAADELSVTASAVSHQIKTLEQFLGVVLFRRNKRKVQLTPQGEQYLLSIRYALDEIEVATQRLKSNPETDVVTISVAPNFLTRWLMPRMQRFQKKFPEVELQITASTGLIDFNRSNTDMAVYFGKGDWHDIDVHFLSDVFLVPVCSPGLITQDKPLVKPEDLRQHTLIHVSKRLDEWPQWLHLSGVESVGFSRGLRLSSSQLATAAAQEGLGVALADSTLSSREITEGKLIMPFDIMLDTQKSFYLVHQKHRMLTHGMRVFKEWVIEEMCDSCV
ncbi:transcriptional regulator GcvA [Neptunomonas sp.]|uniref:transcriptional regulator GcvA n=1 Tax=Neptunomonas sp. TaxID=1971898 RepID=UPI003567C980